MLAFSVTHFFSRYEKSTFEKYARFKRRIHLFLAPPSRQDFWYPIQIRCSVSFAFQRIRDFLILTIFISDPWLFFCSQNKRIPFLPVLLLSSFFIWVFDKGYWCGIGYKMNFCMYVWIPVNSGTLVSFDNTRLVFVRSLRRYIQLCGNYFD